MDAEVIQFNKEIRDFSRSIPQKALVLQKQIVLEALRRLIEKTPVDTGRARGNWQVTIGRPAGGSLDQTDADGQETITAGLAVLAGLKDEQIVWTSNNVDYIEDLEHGHSRQAPHGMLAVTVQELRALFREAA